MTALSFHPFNSANFILDQSILTVGQGCGQSVKATATWGVIRHPEGIVVVDTGLNSGIVEDAAGNWGTGEDRLGVPEFPPERLLKNQLASIGIQPSDVRYVVNTHLHGDHGGANGDLPDATFICQRVEADYARDPDIPSMVREYPLDQLMLDELNYELIDGDLDLFGDGSVQLLQTPGHTPGHMSLLLALPNTGPLILTGDAVQTHSSLNEMVLPSIIWFPSVYVSSRRRLLALAAETGARWFHTHDPDTFGSLGWVEGAEYD